MSSLSEPEWQIQSNGQEYGPYARARILEMLARGELPDTAAIRQAGMPDWLPVPAARQLFQSYQAAGGTLAEAQAPVQPVAPPAPPLDMVQAPEAGEDETQASDDAVDLLPPPAAAGFAMPADGAPPEEGAKRVRSKAPLVYAAIALLVLAGAVWMFSGSDPVGPDGYAKVKEELVRRMDDWRDRGYWLESIPVSAVEGPLVRYRIDPPSAPIGDKDASYTYVVHCTFRDKQGAETESKVTVTMGSKRLRLWNLFSK